MTSITKPNMVTNLMTYNGLDTRVGLTDSAGTKTFQRDGVGVTAPVLTDGTATFTASGENRGGVKTSSSFALKNTDLQTNSAGSVTAERQNDAFGNVIASSGAWKSQFGNAGRFGHQEDADSGLKLLGHRYFDSSTGRFLTRDPIKDGSNWYIYCSGQPVSQYDDCGLRLKYIIYALKNRDDRVIRKFGITKNGKKRCTKKYYEESNVYMDELMTSDDKREILDGERTLIREMPGDMNRERWAGMDKIPLAVAPWPRY